ncbi:MAG: hypothetical protein ATN31_08515 [Candidatus Epulonipiscioides saccharophilum]|nr:MAG: hypothetical protein ATN31_08515 [Epulopiscium sp. AS2M-Bin001]
MENYTILGIVLILICNLIALVSSNTSENTTKSKVKKNEDEDNAILASIILEVEEYNAKVANYILHGQLENDYIGVFYDKFIAEVSSKNLHEDDAETVEMVSSLPYMLELYRQKVREYTYDFRILNEDNKYVWHRAIVTFTKCTDTIVIVITVCKI